MKKFLTSASLVTIVMLSGCGSSAIGERNVLDDKEIHALKISSKIDKSFNKRSRLASAIYGVNSFIFKLDTKDSQESSVKHTQFYINSDNDASTGFQAKKKNTLGIEYLIEDDKLYRYVGDGRSWNWEFVENIKYKRTNNTVIIGIENYKSIGLHEGDNKIAISAANLDENWKVTALFGENGGRTMVHGSLSFQKSQPVINRQTRGWFDWILGDETEKESTDTFYKEESETSTNSTEDPDPLYSSDPLFHVDYPYPEITLKTWYDFFFEEDEKEDDNTTIFNVEEYPYTDVTPRDTTEPIVNKGLGWFDWF